MWRRPCTVCESYKSTWLNDSDRAPKNGIKSKRIWTRKVHTSSRIRMKKLLTSQSDYWEESKVYRLKASMLSAEELGGISSTSSTSKETPEMSWISEVSADALVVKAAKEEAKILNIIFSGEKAYFFNASRVRRCVKYYNIVVWTSSYCTFRCRNPHGLSSRVHGL